MDKNILIAEILYTVFCYHKGHGKRYKKTELINEISVMGQLVELLYKSQLDAQDLELIKKGLDIAKKYNSTDISSFELSELKCEPIANTADIRPADMMRDIIRAVITEARKTFRNDIVVYYIFALHNLPRAYMSNTQAYLGHINGRADPDDAIKWSMGWLDKIKKEYQ